MRRFHSIISTMKKVEEAPEAENNGVGDGRQGRSLGMGTEMRGGDGKEGTLEAYGRSLQGGLTGVCGGGWPRHSEEGRRHASCWMDGRSCLTSARLRGLL